MVSIRPRKISTVEPDGSAVTESGSWSDAVVTVIVQSIVNSMGGWRNVSIVETNVIDPATTQGYHKIEIHRV